MKLSEGIRGGPINEVGERKTLFKAKSQPLYFSNPLNNEIYYSSRKKQIGVL
jgi:hypothetical protein